MGIRIVVVRHALDQVGPRRGLMATLPIAICGPAPGAVTPPANGNTHPIALINSNIFYLTNKCFVSIIAVT